MRTITAYVFLFQLLSVSFPEEFFFRGFLQDTIGGNFRSVLLVSLLFAVAHVPKVLFLGDWMSLLTFFPSLVMGWLYMKTNNILPGTDIPSPGKPHLSGSALLLRSSQK